MSIQKLTWSPAAWKSYPNSYEDEDFLTALSKIANINSNLHTLNYIECIKVGIERLTTKVPTPKQEKVFKHYWWQMRLDAPTSVQGEHLMTAAQKCRAIPSCHYDPIAQTQWRHSLLKLIYPKLDQQPIALEVDYIYALMPWTSNTKSTYAFPDVTKAPEWVINYSEWITNKTPTTFETFKKSLEMLSSLEISNIAKAMVTLTNIPLDYKCAGLEIWSLSLARLNFSVYEKENAIATALCLLQEPQLDKHAIIGSMVEVINHWCHCTKEPILIQNIVVIPTTLC